MNIHQIRCEYVDGNAFWAAEAILELEKASTGAALCWAVDSAQHLVEVVRPANHELLSTALHALRSMNDGDFQSKWIEQAEVIENQYRDDDLSLVVAHLLCAKASFHSGDM